MAVTTEVSTQEVRELHMSGFSASASAETCQSSKLPLLAVRSPGFYFLFLIKGKTLPLQFFLTDLNMSLNSYVCMKCLFSEAHT